MELGNVLLAALRDAGVQGLPQPQRQPQQRDACKIKCYACGEYGHMKKDCPKRQARTLMAAADATANAAEDASDLGSKN